MVRTRLLLLLLLLLLLGVYYVDRSTLIIVANMLQYLGLLTLILLEYYGLLVFILVGLVMLLGHDNALLLWVVKLLLGRWPTANILKSLLETLELLLLGKLG